MHGTLTPYANVRQMKALLLPRYARLSDAPSPKNEADPLWGLLEFFFFLFSFRPLQNGFEIPILRNLRDFYWEHFFHSLFS